MTGGRIWAAATRLPASAALVLTVGCFIVLSFGLAESASAAPVVLSAPICPQAPPGVETFANQVTGWVKWGVLALVGISAVVSLGAILAGRIFSHPHASRYGAMGVAVFVMGAITYTGILVILDSITGSGCT